MTRPDVATIAALMAIAYFISRKFHLEGGPQINFTAGRYTPDGGAAQGFTTFEGGFAVGLGYSF